MSFDLTEQSPQLLHLDHVSCQRNGRALLHNIDLRLPDHGLVVLLGANGAGKSSFLKLLAGVSRLSDGHIHGVEKITLGWMPEPAQFYDYLTVQEHLYLQADLLQLKDPEKAISELMTQWQLADVAGTMAQYLSLGYRQRLSLTMALLGRPQVLLLDEPMNGMDPELLQQFKLFLADIKTDTLVLMATHLLAEVGKLVDHCIVMHQSQLLAHRCFISTTDVSPDLSGFYQHTLKQWQQQGLTT